VAIPALQSLSLLGASRAGAAVIDPTGVIEIAGSTDEVFPLASVTKMLVAYAVLIASEEGSLSLDDPVGPPDSTLAHLLAHCSGIAPNDVGVILAPPGRRRIYSTAAFEVIAAHLDAATGFDVEAYLHAAVFEPLGMRHSRLAGAPGAGAISSVEDLSAFASELLAPVLISPETHARATAIAFPGLNGVLPGFGRQDPCDFGLGFEIRDHKSPHWTGSLNSPATFGHFGQSGTFLWVDPVARLALVVLTDRPFGSWAAKGWPPLSDEVIETYPGPK
jgi:CubicO group peptidase (beta-lactamase class C family)